MPPLPIAPRPTVFVTSPRLSSHAGSGLDIVLATETFQYTGSFKFRGAFNTVVHTSAAHLIAASSGNFGQALAFAAVLTRPERFEGKRVCCVVTGGNVDPVVYARLLHLAKGA